VRILGIDPGTARVGYGVIEGEEEVRLVNQGVLSFPCHLALAQRMNLLYLRMLDISREFNPDEVAIEEPFFSQNAHSALTIGRAEAVAILAFSLQHIPVCVYTPTQIKMAVTSYGGSGKGQVQEMVRLLLGLPSPPPSDAADALACAICHWQQKRVADLIHDSRG
jgi:crossover junction endodeoxyribonuclease RuvC